VSFYSFRKEEEVSTENVSTACFSAPALGSAVLPRGACILSLTAVLVGHPRLIA
jgi:hypothetical protein